MLLPAEIEARTSVPAIRALVARKLTKQYHMGQQDIARVLGLTQAAVSNYITGRRGSVFSDDELVSIDGVVSQICTMLLSGAESAKVISKFDEACQIMRHKRLLCSVHKQLDANLDVENCHVCDGESEWKPVTLKLS
ncbi:MAG: hypothetical protein FJ358_06250 [Thaumarchaeota archaeon]|nr:hypothetical protein [Nitrososphaerota archaeon]